MANLKNITELPMADSAEGLNLIVNDNGAAKQIPANAVGGTGAQSKELMYEWNFSAEDAVVALDENTDDDLTWLTTKQENIDYEIVVELYATNDYIDESGNQNISVIRDTISTLDSMHGNYEFTNYTNVPCNWNGDSSIIYIPHALIGELYGYYSFNETSLSDSTMFYLKDYCYIQIFNNVHFDYNNGIYQVVDKGGNFYIDTFSEDTTTIKSVRIYKITH